METFLHLHGTSSEVIFAAINSSLYCVCNIEVFGNSYFLWKEW